jgi:hypothetical protein
LFFYRNFFYKTQPSNAARRESSPSKKLHFMINHLRVHNRNGCGRMEGRFKPAGNPARMRRNRRAPQFCCGYNDQAQSTPNFARLGREMATSGAWRSRSRASRQRPTALDGFAYGKVEGRMSTWPMAR